MNWKLSFYGLKLFCAINVLYEVILEICFVGASTNQLKSMLAKVDISL